jgi:hypothetical protein
LEAVPLAVFFTLDGLANDTSTLLGIPSELGPAERFFSRAGRCCVSFSQSILNKNNFFPPSAYTLPPPFNTTNNTEPRENYLYTDFLPSQ